MWLQTFGFISIWGRMLLGWENWPFMNANLFEVALALMFWIQFQSHALCLVCLGRSFRLKMEVIWKQRNSDSLRDGFPFTFYLPWWCSIDSRIMFQGRQMFVRIWIRRRKLLESSSTRGIALCEFFSRFVCPFGVETIPWTCFKDWKSLLEFPFEDKFSCRWRLCICSLLSLRSFAWAGDLESVPNRSSETASLCQTSIRKRNLLACDQKRAIWGGTATLGD